MSRILEDRAIAVHSQRYSETSLIVTWFTAEHGILKTMVKGALKQKQPQYHGLDVWADGDLQWSHSPQTHLHTLREFSLKNSHAHLRSDYAKGLFCAYAYESIFKLTETDTPLTEFFLLLVQCIDYLQEHQPSHTLLNRFHLRLLNLAGFASEDASTLETLWHSTPKTKKLLERELAKMQR